MKFSTLALATISLSTVTEARHTLGAKAIERSMNSVDQRALLKSARKLQNEDNEEESNFELTGEYSIRFNSCVSIEIEQEEESDENNEDNQAYGGAIAYQQMIIVDLVSSNSSIPTQEIAMDIGAYVNSVGRMVYEQVESYCDVCEEIAETCAEEGQSNWLAQQTKKYFNTEQGSTVEYVDCQTCDLYNCNARDEETETENEDEDENENSNTTEYDMESAFDYLEELSQCQAFSVSYQNSEYVESTQNDYNQEEDQDQNSQSMYIGYQCTEYGGGIELSFFLDEDCTYATNEMQVADNIPYSSMAGQYLQMSQNLVNGIFENSFSCNNIEFVSPLNNDEGEENSDNNSTWYNFQYYGNNADGDNDIPEANDYCQSIFEEENTMTLECQESSSSFSVASGNWKSWMSGYGANAENETMVEEEQEEEAESDICEAIRTAAKTASNHKQSNYNIYNGYGNNNKNNNNNKYAVEEEDATGYDYRSFGEYNDNHRVAENRTSVSTILMYIGVAAAMIVGAALFSQKKKESNEAKKQSLILEGDAGDYKAEGEIA